ncbi:MAG: hypothetical protein M1821_007349 [Bathelium mastoideum]|nr:MAG: hypothetical protein M1821_007349 [Bathelium mastoideum]
MTSAWGIRDSPGPSGYKSAGASSSSSSVIIQRSKDMAVELLSPKTSDGYISFTEEEKRVHKVMKEHRGKRGEVIYKVRFADSHTEEVPFDQLLKLENGMSALKDFNNNAKGVKHDDTTSEGEDEVGIADIRVSRGARVSGHAIPASINLSSESEPSSEPKKRRPGRPRGSGTRIRLSARDSNTSTRARTRARDADSASASSRTSEGSEESDEGPSRRRSKRQASMEKKRTRSLSYQRLSYRGNAVEEFEESSSEEGFVLQSDVIPPSRKRKRGIAQRRPGRPRVHHDDIDFEQSAATRRSGRSTRHQQNMQEAAIDDIYRSDSDRAPAAPKAVGAREVFKTLPRDDDFRVRHCQQCESCGNGPVVGQLIYCQGCTLAYHKSCLGPRNGREHLVTKVGDDDSVLQCRRCISFPKKKEHTAPDQGKCQVCREPGQSCLPFRERKTMLQEQKAREENNGQDPITEVDADLINNVDSVLFRCLSCWRAWHFQHLPAVNGTELMDIDDDDESLADQRFREYYHKWRCTECQNMPAKVAGLIAWKPVDEDEYTAGFNADMVDEDDKAYLVKWEGMSYFRASWKPGAWVWGISNSSMRRAFAKREEGQLPKMRTEDAIPEEFLRVDIVLDVKFTSIVDIRTEEVDKARIKEVDKALVKYKGLGYEDAVWESPPATDELERWNDFVIAYNDWVMGRYVHLPKPHALKARLEKVRLLNFGQKLEKKKQPDNIKGGELMQYQIEGLNWLYYRWYCNENAILADEMGLGKTIQIISLLATLVQDHNCFPFLLVVPNSTCPNWRREIKNWAPSLRVVTYFGSAAARDLAYRHELFPEGSKELRCHVVVTSYEAAADDSCARFFRRVPWQGLVVDEGQRIKNDKTMLYSALSSLKVPFRILVTGTPLQNNARELFNLLQFLDESFNAAALEVEYAELTAQNVPRLHDMVRPYFLRRTKAQVLTFLPPMAQIIVPVSMSVVQKKLYKSILAKNPDLLRAVFTADAVKKSDRGSLNNILMQLRKCLCHPFVYSQEIEERSTNAAVSHRNLVEASSKLQLLELLLPKLKERGHRVLIFSQFLHMLDLIEDFLDGLELAYHRLDGNVSSLQKQKRIDEFNAPNSQFFAFLLSTRAGGVGINLATADTVIILDPDFNPHQDIQALSRAHRIGQKKKVLCYQLMTRASAEEKIVQIGRKKMALDHVLIERMDADDTNDLDMESVLRHGASELFNESSEHDIKYDNASVEKLLDRSQIENTQSGKDNSAESQFSFARVWANEEADFDDSLHGTDTEDIPDPTVWDRILKEREHAAALERAAKEAAFGRGRRARAAVDYAVDERRHNEVIGVDDTSPVKPIKPNKRREKNASESDTDFQAEESDEESEPGEQEAVDPNEVQDQPNSASKSKIPEGTQNKPKGRLPVSPSTPVKRTPPSKASSRRKIDMTKVNASLKQRLAAAAAAPKFLPEKKSPKSKSRPSVNREFRRAHVPVIPVQTPSFAPIAPMYSHDPFASTPGNNLGNFSANVTNPNLPNSSLARAPTTFRWPPGYSPPDGTPTNTPNPSAANNTANPTNLTTQTQHSTTGTTSNTTPQNLPHRPCPACSLPHPRGSCPLKLAGTELCPLCGLAHFGDVRACPHMNSETQVREMLAALRDSPESKELVTEVKKYLRGRKGNLVQRKRAERHKREYERGVGGDLDRESGVVGFGMVAESVGFKG